MTFTAPRSGPCEPFTTWEEVTACGAAPDIGTDLQDLVVEVASETVWALTGERYTGACERTVMPCWPDSCGCYPCGCSRVTRLDLGPLPVWGVSSVMIENADGDLVELDNTDGSTYHVEDWQWLVRDDGTMWPRCQGGWEVTYTYGVAIPTRARRAASLLAVEFAKQCAGLPCGLAVNTSSYSREGMSVTLAAPSEFVAKGFTGIVTVDLLLASLGGRGGGGGLVDLSDYGRERARSWTLVEVDA